MFEWLSSSPTDWSLSGAIARLTPAVTAAAYLLRLWRQRPRDTPSLWRRCWHVGRQMMHPVASMTVALQHCEDDRSTQAVIISSQEHMLERFERALTRLSGSESLVDSVGGSAPTRMRPSSKTKRSNGRTRNYSDPPLISPFETPPPSSSASAGDDERRDHASRSQS